MAARGVVDLSSWPQPEMPQRDEDPLVWNIKQQAKQPSYVYPAPSPLRWEIRRSLRRVESSRRRELPRRWSRGRSGRPAARRTVRSRARSPGRLADDSELAAVPLGVAA
jgi:hypothetical protein